MENFTITKRLTTQMPKEQLAEIVAEQAGYNAKKVEQIGGKIVVRRIGSPSGNDMRKDTTTLEFRKSGNGYTIKADVKSNMNLNSCIMVLLILCLFPFSLLLLLVVLPAQKRQEARVRSDVQDLLDNIAEEVQSMNGPATSYTGPGMQPHPGTVMPMPAVMQMPPVMQPPATMQPQQGSATYPGDQQHAGNRIMPVADPPAVPQSQPTIAAELTNDSVPKQVPDSSFFLKRAGKVSGPITRQKLRELRAGKKLKKDDLLSATKKGPWFAINKVHRLVIDKQLSLPS